MTINISNSGYLAQAVKNRPVVGWHSIVGPTGFSSENTETGSSAGNLWSPDTYTFWESDGASAAEIIVINVPNNEPVNYFAICGHNFADHGFSPNFGGGAYYVRVLMQYSDDGFDWTTIEGSEIRVSKDGPVMSYFDDSEHSFFRLFISMVGTVDGSVNTKISHIRAGQALILERPYFVGNSPNDKQVEKVVNQSDNGRYLGSTLVSVTRPYSIPQENNSNTFVRQYVDDFLDHCELVLEDQAGPLGSFFYAWRPEEFPDDTYYCHAPTNVSRPEYQRPNKMMQWSISGVAEK